MRGGDSFASGDFFAGATGAEPARALAGRGGFGTAAFAEEAGGLATVRPTGPMTGPGRRPVTGPVCGGADVVAGAAEALDADTGGDADVLDAVGAFDGAVEEAGGFPEGFAASFADAAFSALRCASSVARRSAACINSRTAASAIGPTFVGAL
jgi:hypothetical protein